MTLQSQASGLGLKLYVAPWPLAEPRGTMAAPLAFEAEVSELLKEVRVDYEKVTVIQGAIEALRALLKALPEEDQFEPDEATSAFVASLGVPAGKARLPIRRPAVVEAVGSFPLHTVAKPVQNVDVSIEIPKACFLEKDFLNHRYYAKRALYLAAVARHLASSRAFLKLEWAFLAGEARKPILVLTPAPSATGATTRFVIRLLPAIGANTFDVAKLGPGRGNVRSATSKAGQALATPRYNVGVLEDATRGDAARFLGACCAACPPLRDAILLLKVWARQRGLHERTDGVSGFLLSLLAAHSSTDRGGRRITAQMAPSQIFRVALDLLGRGALEGGIFLQQEDGTPCALSGPARSAMERAFEVVVCDGLGRLNLAARVTRSAVAELREHAKATLAALAEGRPGAFEAAFMAPADFAATFDYHIRVEAGGGASPAPPRDGGGGAAPPPPLGPPLDRDTWHARAARVKELLARALGERARLVTLVDDGGSSAPAANLHTGMETLLARPIFIGVLLAEPEVAFRMADIGPSADNKAEARKFRAFWGEKSELRRFKDGSIAETAVWECPPHERHLIIPRIVEHILGRHLAVPAAGVRVDGGQLDWIHAEEGVTDPTAPAAKLQAAMDSLSTRLRSLRDLPLPVVGVQPLSAALRGTAVYPPQPHPLAMEGPVAGMSPPVAACLEPVEVALQLEGSGKWPVDPEAVEATKLAFLLKIARSLEAQHGTPYVPSRGAVDVFVGGFAFRLLVAYEGPAAPAGARRRPPGGAPERDLAMRARHANFIHALVGLHPNVGVVARLAKQWVSCHLFSGQLQEEAVELLVASLFTNPHPSAVPRTRTTGLLRFLRLLGRHDWALSPLIVDVNGDLKVQDVRAIQARFDALREQRPGPDGVEGGPPMFVATPHDWEGATWTRRSPSAAGLKRMAAYARSSAELLACLISGRGDASWQSLFCTPLQLHDVVLLLKHQALPFPQRVHFPARHILRLAPAREEGGGCQLAEVPREALRGGPGAAREALLVGFDPTLLFVGELKARFGAVADVSFSAHGGDAVALTWRPKALASLGPLRPALAHLQMPLARNGKKAADSGGGERLPTTMNKSAVLEDIRAIGEGFVSEIFVNPSSTHPWSA